MSAYKEKPDHEITTKNRPIRSFVLRTGRMTAGQQRAMNELWPLYGIEPGTDALHLDKLFPKPAPIILEIGFGNGENLAAMANNNPECNFIGIEVHEAGMGHCLLRIAEQQNTNVRVIRDDAVEVLRTRILDSSLQRINLFFPDPWHKKRHHKRRIVQTDFVALLANKLVPGGLFHIATDWENYAEHIEEVMSSCKRFKALPEFPTDRIKTRFDARGSRLGHTNWEHAWCKRSKI
ncbi:MAG: tRNA (guanosine(46)-N7)-methyltransferase TrmB [Gammaproteobacteria bacterium]|nr:tRNA (guanosine(46)-N7)-methyltransferase TrmB [Gammaproteobacteria bacterium]MCP4091693.1 tRNA (guanosine(46)-N7)-methyltransferase TrmB [Gammaproteobacteria bacterium]MCP4275000.1 tRNA (guanosine(46)-N7)-methyltransferase TrmB [Gammaproteobacteria bacterium]MCP4831823.1 tRNA (guanosine(46)-N7)-methyltransferase TrmB [Gammaproteobacteria bacterium]MCP4929759.1 tRNA (guanosine(46)-N7)-methyltransferase TrmB [Gammaproteobacteria bacterium]